MADPEPNLEDQRKAEQATAGPTPTDGATATAEGEDELAKFLESDHFLMGRLGYTPNLNPDGSVASWSADMEAQNAREAAEARDAAEVAAEEAAEEAMLAKLPDDVRVRLEPGVSNVDYSDLYAKANAGDIVAKALVADNLDGASLQAIERQIELGAIGRDDLAALIGVRWVQAETDLRAALTGDRDAYVRFLQNYAGSTPTDTDLVGFDSAGGINIRSAEHLFQMAGVETRPQSYLDRINSLLSEADMAGKGDLDAAKQLSSAFGLDPNALFSDGKLNTDRLDLMKSMLGEIAKSDSAPNVPIPGMTATAVEPDAPMEINLDWTPAPITRGSDSDATAGSWGADDLSGQTDSSDAIGDDLEPDPGSEGASGGGGATDDDVGTDDGSGTADDGADAGAAAAAAEAAEAAAAGAAGAGAGAGGDGSGSNAGDDARPSGDVDDSGEGAEFQKWGSGPIVWRQNEDGTRTALDANTLEEVNYVDIDPGGYTNTEISPELAAAYLEQKLIREGGDHAGDAASADRDEPMKFETALDLPKEQSYVTPEGSEASGGGPIPRPPAPSDPVDPDLADEPPTFDGQNPNDPGIYSMGTGSASGDGLQSSRDPTMASSVQTAAPTTEGDAEDAGVPDDSI